MKQISTCSRGGPTLEQADMPGGSCSLQREDHTGERFLTGTKDHGGLTLEQSAPEGLHLAERTHSGAVLGEWQP